MASGQKRKTTGGCHGRNKIQPDESTTLFDAARRIDDPAARRLYIREACGEDLALAGRVEALLRVHDQEPTFLGSPLKEFLSGAPSAEGPGTLIGPYRLLRPIGEGGMGTVFLAEQTEPLRRQVAVKVIRPGMDSREILARFEAERQALALMDHPHIARVLDAGATPAGLPYFVMELIDGVPITKHCDGACMSVRRRLELFVAVCQAVQHAHQKGIIHRDIKPSNVLVTLYDGKAVPKVIDFGIAKAIGPKLTERTLETQVGSVVGTLEYMSPEQAVPGQLNVDTRSDIYSLGVVLYELLTGTTPLGPARSEGADLLDLLRAIRDSEPPPPSTRLGTTEQLPAVAANRGVEPTQLTGLVRGELDWIVMKCLEKDRERRYESANGFLAQDIEAISNAMNRSRHARRREPMGCGNSCGGIVGRCSQRAAWRSCSCWASLAPQSGWCGPNGRGRMRRRHGNTSGRSASSPRRAAPRRRPCSTSWRSTFSPWPGQQDAAAWDRK